MRVDKTLKVCGVYSIINRINNFEYVGSGKFIYKRISHHFSALHGNRHNNEHLQNSFNKYGEDAFEVKILEVCTLEQLHEREEYYISITPNKYNFREKPTGPLVLPTPDAKRRETVRKKLTGMKRTKEQIERISESHKGLKLSDETKQRQSMSRLKYIEENKETIMQQLSDAGKIAAKVSYEKFLLEHPDGRKVVWPILICLFDGCKKEFEVLPYMAKKQKYCSNECRNKAKVGKILTQEHKDKLSIAGKAFYVTEEGQQHLEKLQKATKEYFEEHKIPFETRTCICGCQETFEVKASSKKRYIAGHHKIEKQSEESNRKRSEAMKRFLETPEGLEYKKKLGLIASKGRLSQQALRQKVKSNAN